MDFIQIYSLVFLSFTFLVLFVEAGVKLEKEHSPRALIVAFVSLFLWTPIVGRLFNWW